MSALAPSEKTASPAASAERLSQKATLAQTKLATSVPSGTNQSGSRSEGADFLPSPKSTDAQMNAANEPNIVSTPETVSRAPTPITSSGIWRGGSPARSTAEFEPSLKAGRRYPRRV